MAQSEDIRARGRKLNPRAQEIMDVFDKVRAKHGYTGVTVTTTDDMTPEEEEMALFEGFLKEGYPVEIAARKATEWLIRVKGFSEIFRQRRGSK